MGVRAGGLFEKLFPRREGGAGEGGRRERRGLRLGLWLGVQRWGCGGTAGGPAAARTLDSAAARTVRAVGKVIDPSRSRDRRS